MSKNKIEVANTLTPCHPDGVNLGQNDLSSIKGKVPALEVPRSPERSPEEQDCLRFMGKIGDLKPTVVVDSREQIPLPIKRLPTVRGTLTSGDYSFLGGEENFSVEKKSLEDMISCCMGNNRARFERELHRLRGFQFARFLIIGSREDLENHVYRSEITPKAVLSTLSAFEVRYSVPIVWAPNAEQSAELVERWIYWFAREVVLQSNQVLKPTKKNL